MFDLQDSQVSNTNIKLLLLLLLLLLLKLCVIIAYEKTKVSKGPFDALYEM